MHVAGGEENSKYFVALVLKLLMKNIDNLFVRLFVISLLTFSYFPQFYPFSEPEPPHFLRLRLRLRLRANCFGGSGPGSGSDQNVSAPAAPHPWEASFPFADIHAFFTRCPPTVRNWRRAKILGYLCDIYHFAPLCLVHFPEIRGFAACTCTPQCTTTFQIMHHRRALVELYQCTKFRVAPSKFPGSEDAYACE